MVRRLAEVSGRAAWEELMEFDDALTTVGEGAEERLAFQAAYPV